VSEHKDKDGRPLVVGDRIVWASRDSTRAYMNEGTIERFSKRSRAGYTAPGAPTVQARQPNGGRLVTIGDFTVIRKVSGEP